MCACYKCCAAYTHSQHTHSTLNICGHNGPSATAASSSSAAAAATSRACVSAACARDCSLTFPALRRTRACEIEMEERFRRRFAGPADDHRDWAAGDFAANRQRCSMRKPTEYFRLCAHRPRRSNTRGQRRCNYNIQRSHSHTLAYTPTQQKSSASTHNPL